MRIPQPYWKHSHNCWYVKIDGKHHRLDPDEEKAKEIYKELIGDKSRETGESLASPTVTVRDILEESSRGPKNTASPIRWRGIRNTSAARGASPAS
ncbi:MAG: hypothetical protein HY000_17845 [Planctomycetes bacterium]|nr:hypothetical protein [Planctomycetota bacterium]